MHLAVHLKLTRHCKSSISQYNTKIKLNWKTNSNKLKTPSCVSPVILGNLYQHNLHRSKIHEIRMLFLLIGKGNNIFTFLFQFFQFFFFSNHSTGWLLFCFLALSASGITSWMFWRGHLLKREPVLWDGASGENEREVWKAPFSLESYINTALRFS